jgi:hypothetical protein
MLFLVSALYVFRGIVAMLMGGALFDSGLNALTGMSWKQIVAQSPAIATFINGTQYEAGAFMVGFGLFGIVISSTSYRRGERGAWFTAWIIAVVLVIVFPLTLGAGPPLATVGPPQGLTTEGGAISTFAAVYVVIIGVTLLGLLLPYRKFFPNKQAHR